MHSVKAMNVHLYSKCKKSLTNLLTTRFFFVEYQIKDIDHVLRFKTAVVFNIGHIITLRVATFKHISHT